eukprot:1144427-Pelagomonas_calceolata.AAC.1
MAHFLSAPGHATPSLGACIPTQRLHSCPVVPRRLLHNVSRQVVFCFTHFPLAALSKSDGTAHQPGDACPEPCMQAHPARHVVHCS